MKTILPFIIICMMLCASLTLKGQEAQPKVYDGQVLVKQNIAEIRNDSVFLDMDITIQGVPVYRSYSLILTPVLYSKTDSLNLPYIRINGKHKHRMYKRSFLLSKGRKTDQSAYVVLRDDSLITRVVSYRDTLIYKPWMENAGLCLKGEFKKYNDETIVIYEDVLTEDLNLIP